jgi:hypothetical protein
LQKGKQHFSSDDPLRYEKAQEASRTINPIRTIKIISRLFRRALHNRQLDVFASPPFSRLNGVLLTASTKRKSFTFRQYATRDPHASPKEVSARNKFISVMETLKNAGIPVTEPREFCLRNSIQ